MTFFRHKAHGAKTAAPVEATTVAEAANGHAATATLKPRRRCTKPAVCGVAAGGQASVHGRWCGSVALQRAAFLARFRRLMFPHDTSPEHLKQYNW